MPRDLREILEGAPSLLVGMTLEGNMPFATRGWGFDVDVVHPRSSP